MEYYNDQLNPEFWSEEGQFDPEVREKLLKISEDFYEDLGIDAPIHDIQLTGSMSNYNWNKHSDLDVHILIDFADVNDDEELVKKAIDGWRWIWNVKHDIMIRGYEVEMYVQDIHEPHTASGLYSLKDDKWLVKPKYNPPQVDKNDVNKKFNGIVDYIKRYIKALKKVDDAEEARELYTRAGALKARIGKMRKEGLERDGEFSVENLAFKKLRNTSYMEKLIDVISNSYDKIYTEWHMPITFKDHLLMERGQQGARHRQLGMIGKTMADMSNKTGKLRTAQVVPDVHKKDPNDKIKEDLIDGINKGLIGTPHAINTKEIELLRDRYGIDFFDRTKDTKINKTGLAVRFNQENGKYYIIKSDV